MDIFYRITVFVLCALFIITAVRAIVKKHTPRILIYTCRDGHCAECKIRDLIRKNPDTEIMIIDRTNMQDAHAVLKMLERDFPQIHIKKEQ